MLGGKPEKHTQKIFQIRKIQIKSLRFESRFIFGKGETSFLGQTFSTRGCDQGSVVSAAGRGRVRDFRCRRAEDRRTSRAEATGIPKYSACTSIQGSKIKSIRGSKNPQRGWNTYLCTFPQFLRVRKCLRTTPLTRRNTLKI